MYLCARLTVSPLIYVCDVCLWGWQSEEAYAVAIHPSGFQVVGGFKERVRVYNTLLDDLR
jgi:hypothetical protein